jgi:hypothetical protein
MDTAVWYMSERLLGTDVRESLESSVVIRSATDWREEHACVIGASELQFNDVYAEVPLWCASGPIARRWIVPTCVWKLYDCKNGSEWWKIATRGPVGRIL